MATAVMSGQTTPPLAGATAAEFTSAEFFAMIEAGIFDDRPVFLWDGRIYERMAKTVAHAATTMAIATDLGRRLPAGWLLCPENPLRITDRQVPLPDFTIVRGPASRYRDEGRHPVPADVGLLIEVAVTSLAEDLGRRASTWALGGVARYWVADVLGRRIVAHHAPRTDGGTPRYEQVVEYKPGELIPLVLDDLEVARIPVEALLP